MSNPAPSSLSFNPENCIICQESDPSQETTASAHGRERVIEAADTRKDIVFERLQNIGNVNFVYHVSNKCYKGYTNRTNLDRLGKRQQESQTQTVLNDQNGPSVEKKSRRSLSVGRDPPCHPSKYDQYTRKCVICSAAKRNGVYEKFRISEVERANDFLNATSVLLDVVYTRTSDLKDAQAVFGADLYYHQRCFQNYVKQAQRRSSGEVEVATSTVTGSADGNEPVNDPSADILKNCGASLRQSILKEDFDLNDRFCDAYELEEAYEKIVIPDSVAEFFSGLFECDTADTITSNDGLKRKVVAIYQIIFFILNNGRKRTPLHMLNSEAVYNACRSKTLISSLNHFGLAISYDEILRYHTDMASLVSENNSGKVPLPSAFDPAMFTIAAFDNFDHEVCTLSGKDGTHDTVSILMQDKSPAFQNRKPRISETSVLHRQRQFTQELACQSLQDYIRPAKRPTFPENYQVPDGLCKMDDTKVLLIRKVDTAWLVSKLDLSDITEGVINATCENQTMPSWSAFNSLITEETVPLKVIGFVPVLPYPVTEHKTVYTAMKNFQDVLSQLHQVQLPVFCDEGVYQVAREIMMNKPEEFSNLVLCLGSFHMIKAVMGAIGKYVSGSGAETALVEGQVFGDKVVQSVFDGKHYVRSLKGLMLLSECIERLQWMEFFKINGVQAYVSELQVLSEMKSAVSGKKQVESKRLLQSFMEGSSPMIEDFNNFRSSQCEKSETFSFWDHFVQMVCILRDLVRADREGNWDLHLHCVQAILPLFAGCDRVNYLRWGSVYLEDMRQLPEKAPFVYENFRAGKFAVKRTEGNFVAIGPDMCLEQTINRSQKSSSGIIGSTRKKQFVAQWEMIYHEMLAVVNLQRELSGTIQANTELLVNHEFNTPATLASEANVQAVIEYINKHENPVAISSAGETNDHPKLHNIFTQEIMSGDIRNGLLNFESSSSKLYETFRTERFVTRKRSVFDTISKNNLKNFKSSNPAKGNKEQREKDSQKQQAEAQKLFDVARVRDYDVKELLKYDLVESTYLFDRAGLMTKPNKSELCLELEKRLAKEDYVPRNKWSREKTTCLVDVMGCLRRMSLANVKTCGELCTNFMKMVYGLCGSSDRIDFIFDTYVEGSVKDSERVRRSSCNPIDINEFHTETKLPVSKDAFWASSANKSKLQETLRSHILDEQNERTELIVSAMGKLDELRPCRSSRNGSVREVPSLNVEIEEADLRFIPHALDAVQHGANRVILLSNDTDVVVLGLHYWHLLKGHGLKELWIRAGVANTTRYVPLHTLGDNLGEELCQVLIAVHHLTGCDATSKFGTKAAGLKADPVYYLRNFGKDACNIEMELVERYLLAVYKTGTKCATMDELRYHLYHHSKKTILDLPPTSRATEGHILRAFYGVHLQMHCLDSAQPELDPTSFGYCKDDTILVPEKNHVLLPDDFPKPCKCTTCATKRCPCRQLGKNGMKCSVYCDCQVKNACKNPLK